MDLVPTPEQEQLIDAARAFVQGELPVSRLQSSSDAQTGLLGKLGALGWLGMSRPEAVGGIGFSVADEALFFRELGRELGPVSALAAAIAARLLPQDASELVARLSSGSAVAAMAVPEQPVELVARSGPLRLFSTGTPAFAVLPLDAATLVLQLPDDGCEQLPSLDPAVVLARCDLAACRVIHVADGQAGWSHGLLLTAATLVGMAEATRDMINEYAKIRQTFGRPIGAYQAVRHPIAEMAARCEHAKCLLFYASLAFAAGRRDAHLQASAARVIAQQAAARNADTNIQLHGGIGVTDDLPAHRYLKRTLALGTWFGGARQQLRAILPQPPADI